VDGVVRFAPDQASANINEKMVNYVTIEENMIEAAQKGEPLMPKVKSLLDCLALETSWKQAQHIQDQLCQTPCPDKPHSEKDCGCHEINVYKKALVKS
jgi:hypothetical protein